MVMIITWNEDLHLLYCPVSSSSGKDTEDKENKDYPEIYRGGINYHRSKFKTCIGKWIL